MIIILMLSSVNIFHAQLINREDIKRRSSDRYLSFLNL